MASLVILVAGIATLVILQRRNKAEEQEEEECPQDGDEDKEGSMSKILDRTANLRAHLGLFDWSKKHDLIQL